MALVMAKPRLARCAPGRSVARRSLQGWAVQEPTPEARPPRRIRDIYGGAGRQKRSDKSAMWHPRNLRSPWRPWRAIWWARCTCWPATPRTAWQPPWRGSGGRSWPATREFVRSARDAEKPAPELEPTCNSRLGPADRRKEDALNERRRAELVPETGAMALSARHHRR